MCFSVLCGVVVVGVSVCVCVNSLTYAHTQTFDTRISEEALLFAKYLRNQKEAWIPRIAIPN